MHFSSGCNQFTPSCNYYNVVVEKKKENGKNKQMANNKFLHHSLQHLQKTPEAIPAHSYWCTVNSFAYVTRRFDAVYSGKFQTYRYNA